MLSQYFTGSIAKVMLANCHLEDALLAELSCSPSTRVAFFMDRAKLEISDSARLLENSINALDQLANRMKEIEYADTSRSTVSDYERLGSELVQNRLIPHNPQSWEMISKVRHEESFFGICELFRERFQDIIATIMDHCFQNSVYLSRFKSSATRTKQEKACYWVAFSCCRLYAIPKNQE